MKKVLLLMSLLLIYCTGCSTQKIEPQELLKDIVQPSMNNFYQTTDSWYFFHNDKIYAFLSYVRLDGEREGDVLFSCDLDGSNARKIYSGRDINSARLYLLNGDNLFLYSPYYPGIVKINITTGEVTQCVKDKNLYMLSNTLKDNKVAVNYEYAVIDNPHMYFAKFDLDTFEITDEKHMVISDSTTFYSVSNHKVYYIDDVYNSDIMNVYEDDKIIYSYQLDSNEIRTNNEVVFVQDNYIFVISNDKIIKIDINDYSVLEEKDLKDNGYHMIKSTTSGAASSADNIWSVNYTTTLEAPVFCNEDEKVIARFNSETLEFEKIIDASEYKFSYPYGQEAFIVDRVLQYDKYLVIQLDLNTIIYDNETNEYKIYDSCNYTVEDGYIYLMTFTGDYYHQSGDCEFMVEKILLEDSVK